MNIVGSRNIFYFFSALLVISSVASLARYGLNLGTDFTGDAILEIGWSGEKPKEETVRGALDSIGIRVIALDDGGGGNWRIRTEYLSEEQHREALSEFTKLGEMRERAFVSTGPSVSRQLRRNSLFAIVVALVAIMLYITFAFRKVSRPVPSWVYGIIAVVTLAHDVVIPTGLFSFLRIEIDALFISALLTVLGFSVHDTIVVFDRIREHLRRDTGREFTDIVERGLHETIVRSINTSLTTLLALAAIYVFGGESTKFLALALIVGIGVGTYSSIFIASPLLVSWHRWRRGK